MILAVLGLLISATSSMAIALLLGHVGRRGLNARQVLVWNYPMAALLGAVQTSWWPRQPRVILAAVLLGALFFFSFWLFNRAIQTQGVAASVMAGRLSLAVPVLLSLWLWGERPGWLQVGALLATLSILLFWQEGVTRAPGWILVGVWLLFGLIDSGMKWFAATLSEVPQAGFLSLIFASAAVWGHLYLRFEGSSWDRRTLLWGLLLGLPNYLSSWGLLVALGGLQAYLVFPVLNLTILVGSALLARLLLGESLSVRRRWLMGLAAVAVILLSLGT